MPARTHNDRLRIAYVSRQRVLEILCDLGLFSEHTRVLQVEPDAARNAWALLLENPAFAPVPTGCQVPTLPWVYDEENLPEILEAAARRLRGERERRAELEREAVAVGGRIPREG